MDAAWLDGLLRYWSPDEIRANVLIFFNLAGALLLGMLVGFERSYRGRAAGMRTYALVCMASCALTVVAGYPLQWYGGAVSQWSAAQPLPDPTRVIQGIATGVGFIGAGVILKDGLHISGLTTAASIWAASSIGVLVGLGFYSAAFLLAGLTASCMMWAGRLEGWLPMRHAIALVVGFPAGSVPPQAELGDRLAALGYSIAPGSFAVRHGEGRTEWRFVAISSGRKDVLPLTELSAQLLRDARIATLDIQHARN